MRRNKKKEIIKIFKFFVKLEGRRVNANKETAAGGKGRKKTNARMRGTKEDGTRGQMWERVRPHRK